MKFVFCNSSPQKKNGFAKVLGKIEKNELSMISEERDSFRWKTLVPIFVTNETLMFV